MNQGEAPKKKNQCAGVISQRCDALRLACWRLGAGTDKLATPAVEGAAGEWLGATSIQERVKSLAETWIRDENPEPVELAPGCWLVGALGRRNRRVAGAVVGITFEPGAFEGAWFTELCRETGVDSIEAREGLTPYTWPGPVDLDLLMRTFTQTIKDLSQSQADRVALDQFSEQLIDTYEQTHLLFDLARMMNSLENPSKLIPNYCEQILPVFPFKWIAARFCQSDRHVEGMTDRMYVAGDLPCAENEFDRAVVEQFSVMKQGDWTPLLEPVDGGVAGLVGSEVIAMKITHDDQMVGVLLAGNKTGPCVMECDVTSGEMQFIEAASNMLGVFHENIARFDDLRRSFLGTLQALTAAIDAKDPYTRGHSERVAYMSAELAKAMGLPKDEVERIHTSGLVHDVGKIGVPEAVLCKPGKLTDEEFDLIKRHPQIGYDILHAVPTIEPLLPGVLHHHERWDGRGYPHGLKGKDIPLMGRVMALADTFAAMSSTRSYRPAMPREKVLKEIRDCAGTQFDPALAPLFVKLDFTEYDRMVEKHKSLSQFAA